MLAGATVLSGRKGAMFVYVGAYTEPSLGSADGIVVFRFDADRSVLHPVQTLPGVVNPSWLTLDGPEQILFAVNEEERGASVPSLAMRRLGRCDR